MIKRAWKSKNSWGHINNDLKSGPVRESNPGPLTPEVRIIPLDQQADSCHVSFCYLVMKFPLVADVFQGLCVLRLLSLGIPDEVCCD